jgi:hypothetical protein
VVVDGFSRVKSGAPVTPTEAPPLPMQAAAPPPPAAPPAG